MDEPPGPTGIAGAWACVVGADTLGRVAMTGQDQWIGRVLGARYRLVALIGEGGSGRVYLADDVRLRRQVAVKVLHPGLASDAAFLRRFEAEAQAVAALSHPHVLTVHDWGHDDNGPFLVTEFLAGGSLQALLAAGHRLTPAQAVKVGLEVSSGLAAAHAMGMVHRDIKPANILFDHTGRLRIADFGLVQVLEDVGVTEPDAAFAGTVTYMAPERLDDVTVDGRTDVYSLALTLVEAVTGEIPLAGGTAAEVMLRRRGHDVDVPDQLGAARDVVARAGRADVTQRPTAVELRDGLVESTRQFSAPPRLPLVGALPDGAPPYGGGEPTLVPPTDPSIPATADRPTAPLDSTVSKVPKPRWKPSRGLAAVIALALGALAAVAGWAVSDVDPPRTPSHPVSDYTGWPVAEVRALAEVNGWVLDEDQLRSDDVPVDQVLSQRPAVGAELPAGELLTVEVASGPYLVMTPTVVGLDVDAAQARLAARGFEVETVNPRFDEAIPAGVVLELLIDGDLVLGGGLHEPGLAVSLVVSSGPVPRTVPRLVDLPVEEAVALLAQVQLVLEEAEEREFSDTVPEGAVISQDPSPDLQVDRDSAVVVVVSKGPDLRAVPDLEGLSIAEATRRLEEVGLVRSGVSGGGNVVDASDPPAGTLLRPGDEVLLWAPR